jgi:hypothetical protein
MSAQPGSSADKPAPSPGKANGGGTPAEDKTKPAPSERKDDAKEKGPDEAVCRAFALGWQVSDLHQQASTDSRLEYEPTARLPGLSALSRAERTALGIAQVDAATNLLGDPLKATGIATPSTAELHRAFEHGTTAHVRGQVHLVHRRLLLTLTAADFRLGKAYGLGRALADTCRFPADLASLENEFEANRLLNLQEWLADLESAFPAHAARAVSISLDEWRQWAETQTFASEPVNWSAHHERLSRTLTRQGRLWRAVLSGEKSPTDMLSTDDYLTAADHLFERSSTLLKSVVARHRELTAAVIVLVVLAAYLLLHYSHSPGKELAGLAAAAGALGITWKGIGGLLKAGALRLEAPLWGAELDFAAAAAITRLPGQPVITIDHVRGTAMRPSGPDAAGEGKSTEQP